METAANMAFVEDDQPSGTTGIVPEDYKHHLKTITPREPFIQPGLNLKWYDICPADAAFSSEFS